MRSILGSKKWGLKNKPSFFWPYYWIHIGVKKWDSFFCKKMSLDGVGGDALRLTFSYISIFIIKIQQMTRVSTMDATLVWAHGSCEHLRYLRADEITRVLGNIRQTHLVYSSRVLTRPILRSSMFLLMSGKSPWHISLWAWCQDI